MSGVRYLYEDAEGNELGPYSIEEMRAMVTSGQLKSDTPVRRHGMERWGTLAEFGELLHETVQLRLIPGAAVPEGKVAMRVRSEQRSAGATMLIVVGAGIALSLPIIGWPVSALCFWGASKGSRKWWCSGCAHTLASSGEGECSHCGAKLEGERPDGMSTYQIAKVSYVVSLVCLIVTAFVYWIWNAGDRR